MLKEGTATMTIGVTPDQVFDLVVDLARIADWNPQCHKAEWVPPATGPQQGARFVGHNKQGPARWTRECLVTACDRPREFAFVTTYKGAEQTRWRYVFEPEGQGTKVTESFEVLAVPAYVKIASVLQGKKGEERQLDGVRTSLARLKEVAERR